MTYGEDEDWIPDPSYEDEEPPYYEDQNMNMYKLYKENGHQGDPGFTRSLKGLLVMDEPTMQTLLQLANEDARTNGFRFCVKSLLGGGPEDGSIPEIR